MSGSMARNYAGPVAQKMLLAEHFLCAILTFSISRIAGHIPQIHITREIFTRESCDMRNRLTKYNRCIY